MLRAIDRLSAACAWLAAWGFFTVGAMITYEVVMRNLLNAPTIWAEELSRLAQLWATYLAAAFALRQRDLIAITLVVGRLGPGGRRLAEAFSLTVIAAFSVVAIWWGVQIAADSVAVGRVSETMLGVPNWITESAVPVGFALLLVQALAGLARLAAGEVPEFAAHGHDRELEEHLP